MYLFTQVIIQISLFDDDRCVCERLLDMAQSILKHRGMEHIHVSAFFQNEPFIDDYTKNEAQIFLIDIASGDDRDFGIRAASQIRALYPRCHIAFITANDRTRDAIGQMIRPSGYLDKPVDAAQLDALLGSMIAELQRRDSEALAVQVNGCLHLLPFEDLLYLEKNGKKTSIHSRNRLFISNATLQDLIEQLDDRFIQIDRGIVVNARCIDRVDFRNGLVYVESRARLNLARNRKKALREYFALSKNPSDEEGG